MINLFTLIRRRLLRRRSDRSALAPRRDSEAAESTMSSLLARDSAGAGISPAARDLPRSDTGVQQLVAIGKTAPLPPSTEKLPAIERIRRLPPLKKAIIWSEILAEPKSIRPPE